MVKFHMVAPVGEGHVYGGQATLLNLRDRYPALKFLWIHCIVSTQPFGIEVSDQVEQSNPSNVLFTWASWSASTSAQQIGSTCHQQTFLSVTHQADKAPNYIQNDFQYGVRPPS